MEIRRLGRTDLEVSRIGFGGAPLGLQDYLDREDKSSEGFERRARRAIRSAVDGGITFFDTAPGYGGGRSEEIMGRALEGHRDDLVLATKFGGWHEGDTETLERQFTESLSRLRTDRVDLLQVHGGHYRQADADALLDGGVMDWAERERERGRCRYLGITAETASGPLERLLDSGRFDTLQIAYSFIYQSHCDYQRGPKGIIPFARERDLGILSMRTATSGFLQRVIKQEFPQVPTDELTAFAIRFVLSTEEIDCALIGMRNRREVEMNVELAEDLSNRLDLARLNDRYNLDLDALH